MRADPRLRTLVIRTKTAMRSSAAPVLSTQSKKRLRTYVRGHLPDRGVGAAIIMPMANTEAMTEHLKKISTQVASGAHAVLVLDGAGWHQTGGRLSVPHNITLLHLPRYAPELNPMNAWEYLRANKLFDLVWDICDGIIAPVSSETLAEEPARPSATAQLATRGRSARRTRSASLVPRQR